MLYKKSNIQQKKEVSAMLSILPAEMEAIRASQDKMLEREEKLEKKRKPTSTVTSPEVSPKKLRLVRGLRKILRRNQSQTKIAL